MYTQVRKYEISFKYVWLCIPRFTSAMYTYVYLAMYTYSYHPPNNNHSTHHIYTATKFPPYPQQHNLTPPISSPQQQPQPKQHPSHLHSNKNSGITQVLQSGWRDVWNVLSNDCKNEILMIDPNELLFTLDKYLKKHRLV